MSDLTIVIGNKNYSSWSMRPWLALKQTGRKFREENILLRQADTKDQILSHSAAGKVPVLKHGAVTVWESLAICEYLADAFPDAELWPTDPAARAHARSASSEMHAGFQQLRENMPMDLARDRSRESRADLVRNDIARVAQIWNEARQIFGRKAQSNKAGGNKGGGEFLYGAFTAADAMFAPMVTRFRTYGVVLDEVCNRYMNAVLEWHGFKEWEAGALAETAVIDFEIFSRPH